MAEQMPKQESKQLLEQTGSGTGVLTEAKLLAKPKQNASSPSPSPRRVNSPSTPSERSSTRERRFEVDGWTDEASKPLDSDAGSVPVVRPVVVAGARSAEEIRAYLVRAVEARAQELRDLAEQWLYDGDTDQPINDGYGVLHNLAWFIECDVREGLAAAADAPQPDEDDEERGEPGPCCDCEQGCVMEGGPCLPGPSPAVLPATEQRHV